MIDLKNKVIIEFCNPEVYKTIEFYNTITNIGRNDLLEIYFNGGIQQSFFLGLIDAKNFQTTDVTDTISSHSGWQEYSGISNLVLPSWLSTSDNASGQILQNVNPVTFNISVSGNIEGVYIIGGDNAKTGNTGLLWATAPIDSGQEKVSINDTLNVTYKIQWGSI